MRTPVPHVTVEIRDVEHRQLVAAIEVLSPTNKRREGRREYLERRERFLDSDVHLLEIDLLRKGRRVPMEESSPSLPISSSSAVPNSAPVTEVWPITSGSAPCPESPCRCSGATPTRGWTCSWP